MALRAALLVPFAGASIGADPDGRPHTPFYGFGRKFVTIFLLVVISQIGVFFTVPLVSMASVPLGIADSAMEKLAQVPSYDEFADIATLGPEAAIFIGMCLFGFLFFFSLQCAGAVLVFVDQRRAVGERQRAFDQAMTEAEQEEQIERLQQQPQSNADLRELVRSRMPQKQY